MPANSLDALSLLDVLKLRWLLWRVRRNLAAYDRARKRWRADLDEAERMVANIPALPPRRPRRPL